jgi:glycosyltransferase involved in cell wall biosynthesis
VNIGINALYLLPGKVGGSETYIRNLVKSLLKIDGDNTYVIFINRESRGIFQEADPRIKIILCPIKAANRPIRILWEQCMLPVQVRRHNIDVLLSAGMTSPFFCPVPSVVVILDLQHVNQPKNFSKVHLFFLRTIIYLSAKSADGILAISHQVKNDIVRFYHIFSERIAVSYLAVDHELFTPGNRENSSAIKRKYNLPDRFILYAASSLPHKNHERLLHAFSLVRNDFPGLKLVLIGARDQGERTISAIIADMGLEHDVRLLGWLPFEDVPAVYRAGEAFVYPTLHEGFGLPVLEAMACGVPVVCSRIEPLMEVAGTAALFVDPLDPVDIAEGISSVLNNTPLQRELINKGLLRAREFTWESTAQQTLSFLKAVHGGRCHGQN